MAIIGLQQSQTEVGRIRLGVQMPTAGGKTRPVRLDRFRFTSPRRVLIDKIAELYGGTVEPWQPPRGNPQWQVITNATEVPVLVPPQDPAQSQWYELWSKGGCQRRCDGETEMISQQPCLCDPRERLCKMHTRLRVMLEHVPGLGAWRVDTASYYAAVELPGIAALLAMAQGALPGKLVLSQRTVTRNGETMHFVVPELHADELTPAQLMSGKVQELIAANRAAAVDGQIRQLEARVDYPSLIDAANTVEALFDLHQQYKTGHGEVPPEIVKLFEARAAAIRAGTAPPTPVIDGTVTDQTTQEGLWEQILAACPWDSADELERHFCEVIGRPSDEASDDDLGKFLAWLRRDA